MRLWSIHPRHLDAIGLVAVWREGLLAQKVLLGKTKGYRHHPQLERFRAAANPAGAIGSYLRAIHDESLRRGYRFSGDKIVSRSRPTKITVTRGQLDYEWGHLLKKLKQRSPELYRSERTIASPEPHPLFRVRAGAKAAWERGT